MRNTRKCEGKKYLIVDDNILDKLLDIIKKIIGIEKFDDTKTLIETNDILPDVITLKNIVILITCILKNNDKFHPELFLEEESQMNKYGNNMPC